MNKRVKLKLIHAQWVSSLKKENEKSVIIFKSKKFYKEKKKYTGFIIYTK